jgi:DNA-directed RNA polymerase specialized sigma24 family protein
MTLYSLESLKVDPALEPQTEADTAELRESVATELLRLSPREREAVGAWARISGESCRAVARRHGTSPQTVSNWAASAVEKLRAKLEVHR